jgi:hypothetical protein
MPSKLLSFKISSAGHKLSQAPGMQANMHTNYVPGEFRGSRPVKLPRKPPYRSTRGIDVVTSQTPGKHSIAHTHSIPGEFCGPLPVDPLWKPTLHHASHVEELMWQPRRHQESSVLRILLMLLESLKVHGLWILRGSRTSKFPQDIDAVTSLAPET